MQNNKRKVEDIQSVDSTKRFLILATLTLMIAILAYSGVTKDIELSQTIIELGMGALGGYGIGLSFAKRKA
jgi:hypothetical protein